jgi:hypothetical protein
MAAQGDLFEYAPPEAGAIAFVKHRLPMAGTRLVDRIRERQSVLLVPGEQFGIGRGLRFGFGYDIGRTLEGLALVSRELAALRRR